MASTLTIPLPRDGLWTLDVYHALPDDLPRSVDLVDGVLRVNAAPSPLHNLIGHRLINAIEEFAPAEWRVIGEVDVLLNPDPEEPTEVAPDLVIFSRSHDPRTRPIRAADVVLVGEVVSPGSKRKDRHDYPPRYAAAGIPFYWRVETPVTSDAVHVHAYALRDGSYVLQGEFSGHLTVEQPFPMSFSLDAIADWG